MTQHVEIDWQSLMQDLAEKVRGGFPAIAVKLGYRSETTVRQIAMGMMKPTGPAQILLLRLAKRCLPGKRYELQSA